jgi:hypothetical protein
MTDESADPRRISQRRRALKGAKLVLSNWSVIDCTIRDMSETGARLEFGGPTDIPDEFRLLVVSSNLLVPARRVWQHGLLAGIQFTGEAQPAPPRKW